MVLEDVPFRIRERHGSGGGRDTGGSLFRRSPGALERAAGGAVVGGAFGLGGLSRQAPVGGAAGRSVALATANIRASIHDLDEAPRRTCSLVASCCTTEGGLDLRCYT